MGEKSTEDREFSMEAATSIRASYLEIADNQGPESEIAVGLKKSIDALDLKMTDEEKKEAWDLALDRVARQPAEDEALTKKFRNIGPAIKQEPVSEEEHNERIAKMREQIDARLKPIEKGKETE